MKMMNFKCFVFLKLYKMMKKTLRIIFKKIEKKKKRIQINIDQRVNIFNIKFLF